METVNGIGRLLAAFAFFAVALVLAAAAAYAQAQGGSGGYGVPVSPGKPAPCYNGVQDSGEEGIDCGGACFKDWIEENCDGMDNDKDCFIDEGAVCGKKEAVSDKAATPVSTGETASSQAPAVTPAESTPTPVPQSVPASQPSSLPVQGDVPASVADAFAAEPAPTIQAQIVDPFGTEHAKEIRALGKKNGTYFPENETNAELMKKYEAFVKKHEAEFEAKFEGRSLSEKDTVEVLRQFSEEAYPKPSVQNSQPQSQAPQSFFSKVKGFFKRLFG